MGSPIYLVITMVSTQNLCCPKVMTAALKSEVVSEPLPATQQGASYAAEIW